MEVNWVHFPFSLDIIYGPTEMEKKQTVLRMLLFFCRGMNVAFFNVYFLGKAEEDGFGG